MSLSRLHAIVLLLSLAACNSDKAGIEPAKLQEFKPAAKLEIRWRQSVGDAGFNILTPAVTREGVYAASAKYVFRFDRNSGKQVWRIEPGFTISGGVGAGDGLVLIGSDKGDVAAYEEDDGKLRWKVKVSSEVLSAPKIADDIVVVRTGNGRIAGLNGQDGKRLWLYERSTPTLIVRNHAGVVIRNGMAYAGFAAGKVAAIGLTKGVVIWESAVSQPRGNTELERISDITSLPAVDDTQVCAVAFQGRVACFDAVQGGTLWTRDLSSDKGLALFGKNLYLTDTDSNVLALDRSTGSSLWKNDRLSHRRASVAYPLDDHLLLGDFEGYIHALKSEDGSFAARHKTDGSPILSPPITLGDGALVQTSDGELYSITIR
ncbi:MAG: outer membrane protein assembly factor BamB [Sideroxyarcus sp.]|nr:outer membrane protein assembly factor BamB [Sideroxyarcus sp.]